MSICLSSCIRLCIFLSAFNSHAGPGLSRQRHRTAPKPDDNAVIEPNQNWLPNVDDVYKKIIESPSNADPCSRIKFARFDGHEIITASKHRRKYSELIDNWAKVDRTNPLLDRRVADENGNVGFVSGFYANGDYLITFDQEPKYYAWRAKQATPITVTRPVYCLKGSCDTCASETRMTCTEQCSLSGNPIDYATCIINSMST
jgi:hypothetical protein